MRGRKEVWTVVVGLILIASARPYEQPPPVERTLAETTVCDVVVCV